MTLKNWRAFEYHGFFPFDNNDAHEQQLITNCKLYTVNDINNMKILSSNSHNLYVLHLNCCSLHSKFNAFCAFLLQLEHQPDVICLTESWLAPHDDFLHIPGYNFFNFPRVTGDRGGGIAMYISIKLDVTQCNINIVPVSFLAAFLHLHVPGYNKRISFITVYRPPSTSKDEFLSEFEQLMQCVSLGASDYCIVSGDFNIDLLDKNQYSCSLMNLLLSFNCFPTIYIPTHALTRNASLIDNIFSNFPNVICSGVISEQLSDHLPVFSIFDLKQPPTNTCANNNTTAVRPITKVGLDLASNDLKNEDWSFITSSSNIEDDYNTFINIITNTFNYRLPIKYLIKNKSVATSKQWMTMGIRNSCKNKSKLYKRVVEGTYPIDAYIKYRNKLNYIIKKSKADYYLNIIRSNVRNSKVAWNVVNELLGKNKSNSTLSSNINCNKINEFFVSLGKNAISTLPPKIDNNPTLRCSCKNSFVLSDTNVDEVILITKTIASKASCGIDGISSVMLKHVINVIASPLSMIINKSFHTGTVPSALKLSRVIPIFKSGNKDELINYRPIPLLSVFSKVLEKLVYKRMISFINKNKLITNSQFGFRANHSTSHAVMHLTDLITSFLDKSEKVAGVFLDISKAFDSLDHDILLQKLHAYGFRGLTHQWLASFVTNRFQCVVSNNTQSNFLKITHGIAQGSTLGPLMFILYINDLPDVSDNCDFVLFADDTTVLFHNKNVDQLASNMNNELYAIAEWFINNRLALNLKKTCVLPFYVRKPFIMPSIYVANSLIPCVNNNRFLGVIIDSVLSWTYQVNYICNKLSQCVYMLRACADCVPLHVRLQMYFAFAQSYLLYGVECWGKTSVENLNKILVLQKRLIRYMYSLSPLTHCAPYAASANITFIDDLYYYQLCVLAYKVFNNLPMPSCICHVFSRPHYSHNTRTVSLNFVTLNSKLNIRRYSPLVNCIFVWNSLSNDHRTLTRLHLFKAQLKLTLFCKYH